MPPFKASSASHTEPGGEEHRERAHRRCCPCFATSTERSVLSILYLNQTRPASCGSKGRGCKHRLAREARPMATGGSPGGGYPPAPLLRSASLCQTEHLHPWHGPGHRFPKMSPNIPESWQSTQRGLLWGKASARLGPYVGFLRKALGPAGSCGPSKGINPNGELWVESDPQFFKGFLVM